MELKVSSPAITDADINIVFGGPVVSDSCDQPVEISFRWLSEVTPVKYS